MAMTQAERRVLQSVVRGEAFRGTFSGANGQRDIAAAQDLQRAGLVRLIMLDSRVPGEHRYAVIPPNCEWDFSAMSIRRPSGAEVAA
jgi:hypothetical protein